VCSGSDVETSEPETKKEEMARNQMTMIRVKIQKKCHDVQGEHFYLACAQENPSFLIVCLNLVTVGKKLVSNQ
jgi:hypothetical protein